MSVLCIMGSFAMRQKAVALLTLSPLVPGLPLLPFVPGSPRRPLENTERGHINRMSTWIPDEVTLGCPAFSLLTQETSPCPLKQPVPGSRDAHDGTAWGSLAFGF